MDGRRGNVRRASGGNKSTERNDRQNWNENPQHAGQMRQSGCHTPGKRTNIKGCAFAAIGTSGETARIDKLRKRTHLHYLPGAVSKQKQATRMGSAVMRATPTSCGMAWRPRARFTDKCLNCKRPLLKAGVRTKNKTAIAMACAWRATITS